MGLLNTINKKTMDAGSVKNYMSGIFSSAGRFTDQTLMVPKAFYPFFKLLAKEEKLETSDLSLALDSIFTSLYEHPLTAQAKRLTTFLRAKKILPNEHTTENLIRFVVDQILERSPVAVPDIVVNEFWNFFEELFSEPELKGLAELNLDVVRVIIKTYEPLLVDLINLLKEVKQYNQNKLTQMVDRLSLLTSDLVIIKRQIKAIRYLKPFFATDPKDFKGQAEIISNMVTEFGPFFIKIAQVAVANSNLLPEEIAKELTVFQEDVPPMPASEVIDAFLEAYGKHPNDMYYEFNADDPLKSGSLCSVFKAKKPFEKNGKEYLMPVLVKVRRKNIEREFILGRMVINLALLSSNYWAPHSKIAPFLNAMNLQIEEFVKGFQQELNFIEEGKTQERFSARSTTSAHWNVPEIFNSTEQILEMEYLESAISIAQAKHQMFNDYSKISRRKIAESFIHSIFEQIFIYKEFHGDMHPGNVMVNPKGDLFLIDWGNTIDLNDRFKPVLLYAAGALMAEPKILSRALINLSTEPKENLNRVDKIESMLHETLLKKGVKPLGKNFVLTLIKEGPEGWQKRLQVVTHLMSNTQHLQIVIKSEYLHFTRSLMAICGTYLQMYEEMPKTVLLGDTLKQILTFPMVLLQKNINEKRLQVRNKVNKVFGFIKMFS